MPWKLVSGLKERMRELTGWSKHFGIDLEAARMSPSVMILKIPGLPALANVLRVWLRSGAQSNPVFDWFRYLNIYLKQFGNFALV